MGAATRTFTATVAAGPRGRLVVPVPFDPDEAWGAKARHLVGGTVGGRRVRGEVERTADGPALVMGPAWQRDCGLAAGTTVSVELTPEGPQRADLAEDVAEALAADAAAALFFDSLAQFYRKAYLRWVDATKRRPDERAGRIAEMVRLLAAGHKERPKP
ncbi:YdeI/OmpD-associated family protein [Dactylosporangium sp. CA-139066]|uniref:YdeI/OmpD-associated family protein n=1 Tax=Dactylosporangium sp. CA-139066 TaxID=3239930 RepID=UPI003D92197F